MCRWGGTEYDIRFLRFAFDMCIGSLRQRALFFLALYFSCCQAVLSVALTGCRLCPSVADTTFRLKETLRIPLKFPYLPATGTYSHPCLRCASPAHPCASAAGLPTKFQVPLTVCFMHPHSGVQHRYLVKHWKDRLNHKSKMQCLRTMAFPVTKETSVKWQIQWLYPVFLYRNHPRETLFLS